MSSIFDLIQEMGHEQVVFAQDKTTGLKAIIAIHDTTLGPALGGCRFWNYSSDEEALFDVLRLSRGMTYKAAVAGLALGGGKAVIIGNAQQLRSEALFRGFGRFVDSLGGRYITAEDVNTSVRDMEHVALETRHVTGLSGGSGDPSPVTAFGVFHGIRASVKHRLGKDDLKGIRVAVQGCGAVGSYLCSYLHEAGARLVVADIDEQRVRKLVDKYGAQTSTPQTIHAADVDVFSPCALGAGLNDETIPQIKAPIIAGGANNQLRDEDRHGEMLRERNLVYAPDYVINAGGVINVYHELRGYNADAAKSQASHIYHTLLEIYADSAKTGLPTYKAANRLAERRLQSMRNMSAISRSFSTDRRR